MTFRPRYSLLTLLILTALVAGGVKLWYGPHHVVERSGPHEEVDYTYTRDWQGKIYIHGPHVVRRDKTENDFECVKVNYYLKGVKTGHEQVIVVASFNAKSGLLIGDKPQALSPADEAAFQTAIQQEMDQIKKRGLVPCLRLYRYR